MDKLPTYSGIYLLKFATPIGSEKHKAQYYLGWANNLKKRVDIHKSGKGAAITRFAVENNIQFDAIAIWPHQDRDFERRLKNGKNLKRFDPQINTSLPKKGSLRDGIIQIGC